MKEYFAVALIIYGAIPVLLYMYTRIISKAFFKSKQQFLEGLTYGKERVDAGKSPQTS